MARQLFVFGSVVDYKYPKRQNIIKPPMYFYTPCEGMWRCLFLVCLFMCCFLVPWTPETFEWCFMVDLDRLRHVTPWMDPGATCIVSNGTFKFPIKQLTMFSWLVESPTCFFLPKAFAWNCGNIACVEAVCIFVKCSASLKGSKHDSRARWKFQKQQETTWCWSFITL